MATCGKTLLNYLSATICLGCMPDWQWQRFVLTRNPFQGLKDIDPDAIINATIDIEKDPLQFSILIGRQICEDVNTNCKGILDSFNIFANKSALAVGGFADEITNNQWLWDTFNSSFKHDYRENITKEIKDLSKRNVSWIKPHGEDNYSIDIRTDPTYDPNEQQIKMSHFKSSMRALGKDYTYDPVNYYSFDPSINFEDPLVMDEDVCVWLTHATGCKFCHNTETETRSGLPECAPIPPDIYAIQEETDRQYRDFSAFFFQIRAAIVNYSISDDDLTQNITRHFMFPAFREAEIYLKLKGQSFEKRKEYFETLEKIIIHQYKVFKTKKDSQDEFKIWNDEYWMNFIYAPAFTQGRNFFRELSRLTNLTGGDYKFNCDYDGYCKLCLVPSQECVNASGYNKYCEDCHFSNVRLSSECSNEACITCIYIGGDGDLPYNDTDIEGFEGMEDDLEEMEKCFIRPTIPFYDEKLEEGGKYYAPFYRESDEANYLKIEEEFDLKDESNAPWNIAKIGEWFYKINGSERYSVINIMKIDNSLKIPNASNCTHYDYLVPCKIESPINYCKKWLCNFINTYLFPDFKLVYDPQDRNDSLFYSLFDQITKNTFDMDLYNKSLAYVEIHQRNKWNISYGSSEPGENETYYDVAAMGFQMGRKDDFYLRVADVTEDTDIIRFVENDEEDAFGMRWAVGARLIMVMLGIVLLA